MLNMLCAKITLCLFVTYILWHIRYTYICTHITFLHPRSYTIKTSPKTIFISCSVTEHSFSEKKQQLKQRKNKQLLLQHRNHPPLSFIRKKTHKNKNTYSTQNMETNHSERDARFYRKFWIKLRFVCINVYANGSKTCEVTTTSLRAKYWNFISFEDWV